MKLRTLLAGAVLLGAVAAHADQMPWAENWDAAKKAAASSGKLIMLDFYTDW